MPAQIEAVELRLADPDAADTTPGVQDALVEVRLAEIRLQDHRRARWPDLSVSASYDWLEAELSASLGFSVALLDGGSHRLTAEQLSNDVAAAELALGGARRAARREIDGARLSVVEHEEQRWRLQQEIRLAGLKVEESRAALAAGFTNEADVAAAELEQVVLGHRRQILNAQGWLLRLELDALGGGE